LAVQTRPPLSKLALVPIVNKIFEAIVMGLVGVFVIGFPVILAVVPSLNGDPNPSVLNGLASLGLPLAAIVFAVLVGHHASQLAVSYDAETGVKIGTGLGPTTVPGMLGFLGFFLGAIFLVLAFAILRKATRPSLPTRGVPYDTGRG
jgi:hypothetical protein